VSGDVGTHEGPPYYFSDPLWDGAGCTQGNGCCARIGMPWFYRKLIMPAKDDFEICICKNEAHQYEDVAIEKPEVLNCNRSMKA